MSNPDALLLEVVRAQRNTLLYVQCEVEKRLERIEERLGIPFEPLNLLTDVARSVAQELGMEPGRRPLRAGEYACAFCQRAFVPRVHNQRVCNAVCGERIEVIQERERLRVKRGVAACR